MEDRKKYIYELVNPLNNEAFYIGYTYNIDKRLYEHIHNLNNNKIKKEIITEIVKQGLKPEIKVIHECEDIYNEEFGMYEHERLEIYYIKKYKENGVKLANLTDGGTTAPYNRTKKPVYKFDKDLKLVGNYESITAAAISMNIHPTHICAAYDQKRSFTCFGYYWMSSDDPNNIKINVKKRAIIKQYFGRNMRPIVQYDLNGIFIREYVSQNEAEKITNISSKLINKSLRISNYDQAGGYLWFYSNNVPNEIKYKGRTFSRKIIAFDLNGNFVKKFNSIRNGSKDLNLDETSICKNLKGIITKTGSYTFKYDND